MTTVSIRRRNTGAICIVGGTGFVGRHLARRLNNAGYAVRVLSRRRERHRSMLVLPRVSVETGDVYDTRYLAEQFTGADAVINLVGILNERGHDGHGFDRAHVELPRRIVAACRTSGVTRLLHMSALNANIDGPSHYLRTKGIAEALVHDAQGLAVTSFRPSVVFGPDDSFTTRFATLLRNTPGVFPLACPDARFQPVHIEDVVSAFAIALEKPETVGQRYGLCGPRRYSLQEIVAYLAQVLELKRRIVRLGDRSARAQARVLEYFPGKPFSVDNYRSLQVDSVCEGDFPEVFGVRPAAMEGIVPGYLGRPAARQALDTYRRLAGR